jgi:predicted nucleic acid-binding protein/organic radical activating enzyme
MSDNSNILISYAFLASISENKSDLFKEVYTPLIKRALCYYAQDRDYGTAEDLQKEIWNSYSLAVPLMVLKQVLRYINEELSKKEKQEYGLTLYENGQYFNISRFPFKDLEEQYIKSKRDVNFLEQSFNNYIEKRGFNNIKNGFSGFIEKNKNKLTSFFGNKPYLNQEDFDSTFFPHVEFLQNIDKNNNELFETAKNIFLGSIVATYLESEVNLNTKFDNKVVYYLDTQIILEALDLRHESETKPTLELLNMIKESNGIPLVLDITLEELREVLNHAIDSYNKHTAVTTINEACLRKGINKASLITIKEDLENHLYNELGIRYESIPTTKLEKFKKVNDIKELQNIRFKKSKNAEHDVFAYLYVRDRRGKKLQSPQKAKYWFLSANEPLLKFNQKKLNSNEVPELILPDALASLLWLKNPKKFSGKVADAGFRELIADTVATEYVDKELINEFSSNVDKYTNINEDEYEILQFYIANDSAKKIRSLNENIYQGEYEKFQKGFDDLLSKAKEYRTKELEEKQELKKGKEEADQYSKKVEKENIDNKEIIDNQKRIIADYQKREKENEERFEEFSRELGDVKEFNRDLKEKYHKLLKGIKYFSITFIGGLIGLFVDYFFGFEQMFDFIDNTLSLGGMASVLALFYQLGRDYFIKK